MCINCVTSDQAPEPPWLIPAYVTILVAYVALGLWLTSYVLNWIVGPLFPLVIIELLPRATRSVVRVR